MASKTFSGSARRKPSPDRVDRALAGVRAAVGRLVGLLDDPDPAAVGRAAVALADVGPFAVGPLAAALQRCAAPGDSLILCGVLLTFGMKEPAAVLRALAGVMDRAEGPHAVAAAVAVYRR